MTTELAGVTALVKGCVNLQHTVLTSVLGNGALATLRRAATTIEVKPIGKRVLYSKGQGADSGAGLGVISIGHLGMARMGLIRLGRAPKTSRPATRKICTARTAPPASRAPKENTIHGLHVDHFDAYMHVRARLTV